MGALSKAFLAGFRGDKAAGAAAQAEWEAKLDRAQAKVHRWGEENGEAFDRAGKSIQRLGVKLMLFVSLPLLLTLLVIWLLF